MLDKDVKKGWGGTRQGAGRPKGSVKAEKSKAREQHQIRAYDNEWELIKKFAKIVKEDYPKAIKFYNRLS